MRILESAIITLSSSSGRGGQKSCTHFGGQEHSPLPFFCEGRPNNCQEKSEKKQRTNTTANSFVFAPFRVRRSGNQQQRATFGLNLKGGWRPFQPRKKRLEEEHHYYYVTRGQERDAASTHNKKKKKKVSLLPTHQTRKKEELVNKRIVVVAVLSCEKTFRSSFVPKKSIISRRRRINAREKDEQ